MYVNPIPYIEKGKKFEMRLAFEFDELVEVDEAKRIVAEEIKKMPVEQLAKALSCSKIYPVYPEE